MYSYYKLYLGKYGHYTKKIKKNTTEEIHKEILNADYNEFNCYMVIEHIIDLNQDNIVATGNIFNREEDRPFKREGR